MSKIDGQHSFRSYVLWELKLRGDINENHAGGNAVHALRERLIANGAPMQQTKRNLTTVVAQLRDAGKVTRLVKDRTTYSIRLVKDAKLPECPYPQTNLPAVLDAGAQLVLPDNSLMNGHRDWPISKRLQLIAELSQSVHEDIERAKASL